MPSESNRKGYKKKSLLKPSARHGKIKESRTKPHNTAAGVMSRKHYLS